VRAGPFAKRPAVAVDAPVPLAERLAALRDALDAAGDAPGVDAEPVRALLAKAGARLALGESTVVALAGATGSGKSTLFNAVAGADLSAPGVRRPTTGTAHACVWSSDPGAATGLLDWLGVPRRHLQPVLDPELDGLVLLDLPDHDSTRVENRLEVDRLVELVDVLVWVLDPQKYADAAVHERYLAPYAGHAGVLLVVLNQADRLDPTGLRDCLADLRGLLDREGLAAVPLLAVSARTGLGLDALRTELVARVAARRAATERLVGDVRAVARAARGASVLDGGGMDGGTTDGGTTDGRARDGGAGVGRARDGGAGVGRARDGGAQVAVAVAAGERESLVDALAQAAGVPLVTAAVARTARSRGGVTTGWPPLRLLRGLRPDPLRRLHLTASTATGGAAAARALRSGAADGRGAEGRADGASGAAADGAAAGRTSLPSAAPVERARAAQAVRRVADVSGDGLPEGWRTALRETSKELEAALPARLDRAVARTDLDPGRTPRWWAAISTVQWLVLAAALAGALWLLALAGLAALRLDQVLPLPTVRGIPVPTLLLVAGLVAGLLLTALCRPLVLAWARRAAQRAGRRLRTAIGEVADAEVIGPLTAQRGAYERWWDALARASR